MPIPLPNLDDRTYADLIAEMRSLIPIEYPEWTDHNPSDTGIILLELLSWLTETVLYRINRIPDANYESFLRLLNGPDPIAADNLEDAIAATILGLRERYRAATVDDFEHLILEDWRREPAVQQRGRSWVIQRVQVLPQINLADLQSGETMAPGHISLVIVPAASDTPPLQPSNELCKTLWQWLDQRRLLTTRHHVLSPEYIQVQVQAELRIKPGILALEVRDRAMQTLQQFFDPLNGGQEGVGWPFGRSVYCSEIYQRLAEIQGVDYVPNVTLRTASSNSPLLEVPLKAHELVDLVISEDNFAIREA